MIEAGIRERERDMRNWSCNPYGTGTGTTTFPWIQQSSNDWLSNQEYNPDYKIEEVSYVIIFNFILEFI